MFLSLNRNRIFVFILFAIYTLAFNVRISNAQYGHDPCYTAGLDYGMTVYIFNNSKLTQNNLDFSNIEAKQKWLVARTKDDYIWNVSFDESEICTKVEIIVINLSMIDDLRRKFDKDGIPQGMNEWVVQYEGKIYWITNNHEKYFIELYKKQDFKSDVIDE